MDERLKALLFPRSLCLGCDEPREIDAGAPLCDRCKEELEALRLILAGDGKIDHLFADLAHREPQLPEHLRAGSSLDDGS